MEELYYIPIEKEGNEFFQKVALDNFELTELSVKKYKFVIDKHFEKKKSIVNLKTGKFLTTVYYPIDKKVDIFFCLVNNNSYPCEAKEMELEDSNIEEIKSSLAIKVRYSEGIIKEQIVDILSNFVTPRVKFSNSEYELYYNYKLFSNNCLIFGAPGSGKTTLLRRLTLDYLYNFLETDNKLNKLPIYIQLRDFNNYSNNFDTYIENCIKNSFDDLDFYNKHNLLNSGNLCLMLDGADEIDYEKFQLFKNTIVSYKKKNPLVSFIITTRPDRNYENIEDFIKCYVLPFNRNQIKELTFRKLSKENKWKDYFSILNSSPEVYDILKNPLLLTISHFLYLHKSILPINSGQLIKELVATLVNNWDSQRSIERKLNNEKVSPVEITNLLGKLALLYSELQKTSLSIDELYPHFEYFDSINDFETYLKYIEFSTGIFKIDKNEKWTFSHKSIQDYFCSSYLVESLSELNKKIFIEKDWDKVLKMISGLSSDPNYVINSILNDSNRTKEDKLLNSLSVFNESLLLTKQDIQNSFILLELYFVEFEENNELKNEDIIISKHNVDISLGFKTKGFKEIILLLQAIFKTRFTKYEYDFYGYLNHSKSKLLKSISNLTLEKGNMSIESSENKTLIQYTEESPEIEE